MNPRPLDYDRTFRTLKMLEITPCLTRLGFIPMTFGSVKELFIH